MLLLRRLRERQRRRLWVRPVLLRREQCGEFHTLVQELRQHDPGHRRYLRMNVNELDSILKKVEPTITKQVTHLRDPVSAAERLAATLLYVHTISHMAMLFIPMNIWNCMSKSYFPSR